jgi:hypothetical protein
MGLVIGQRPERSLTLYAGLIMEETTSDFALLLTCSRVSRYVHNGTLTTASNVKALHGASGILGPVERSTEVSVGSNGQWRNMPTKPQ